MPEMPTFTFHFEVDAPLSAVAAFHRDAKALPRLTPPPIFIHIHRAEALAEGSRVDMTMWFGPIPVAWTAVHDRVEPLTGFRDTAVRSPMQRWQHTHRFTALAADRTAVHEHIAYAYHPGPRGWFSRLLFNPPGLWLLFAYRRWATRRALNRRPAQGAA